MIEGFWKIYKYVIKSLSLLAKIFLYHGLLSEHVKLALSEILLYNINKMSEFKTNERSALQEELSLRPVDFQDINSVMLD